MKTHGARPRPFTGSFGIPPEVEENRKAFQEKKAAEEADTPDGEETPSLEDDDVDGTAEEEESPETFSAADLSRLSPRKALTALGIVLSDQDFHSVLYRGFVEKVVVIMPAMGSLKPMEAKIKTLTPEEYNLVDEIVAEALDSTKGTNLGFQTRRELWTISFATIEINGKEIAKVKRGKDGEPDLKELARTRYKMLSQLSPAVINKIIRINNVMSWAISAIVEDPKANF